MIVKVTFPTFSSLKIHFLKISIPYFSQMTRDIELNLNGFFSEYLITWSAGTLLSIVPASSKFYVYKYLTCQEKSPLLA